MKLPEDTLINRQKLTDYLLKPRARNDKSSFLNELGYHSGNWQKLREAITLQILPQKSIIIEETQYGTMYRIASELTGANGKTRKVLTFCMHRLEDSKVHLVTMYPDKGK